MFSKTEPDSVKNKDDDYLIIPKHSISPSEEVSVIPPEKPVPLHVKEGIPQELSRQVDKMLGYKEEKLHISLGVFSVNMENVLLKQELLKGLSDIVAKNSLPVHLDLW